MSEPLWKVEDVARYLGVSPSWVYHQNAAGKLPRMPGLGALVRFDPEAIRRWARGEVESPGADVLTLRPGG